MNESALVVLSATSVILTLVLYVWQSLAFAALFRKAGEAGWQGWVPILNVAVVLRLGGFSPWLVFIVLIPFFGQVALAVVFIVSAHRINRSFGFGAGMTVLAAFFAIIWASVLGFGSARWIGGGPARTSAPPAPPAPFVGAPPAPPLSGPSVSIPAPAAPAPSAWAPQPSAPAPAAPPTIATPVVAGPAFPATGGPAFPPPPPLPTAASPALEDELEDSAVDPEDRVAPAPRRTGSFLPPEDPAPPAEPAPAVGPIASVPGTRSSQPAAPAPAPVADVPAAPEPAAPAEPWAPAPGVAAAPLGDPGPDDGFPEPSEAVSAVYGAPDAGSPRSARSSVSALYAQAGVPEEAPVAAAADLDDDLEAMDQTVIARRRRIPWVLIPPGGAPIDISADVVILGRRPAADASFPNAQLVSISDETRTVSKTHARLELRGETWFVTDLGSTNGVLFATLMGTEVEAQPGQEIEAGERFFLGDAEVRLSRSAE